MAVVTMSKREFDQLEVLLGVQSGRLRVADACALLGRSRRQVFRLLRGIRDGGASSLVSKRRGKPSNRRLPDAVRQLAMSLVREHYGDFGPTLAAEKLAERHGCRVSRETLRSWMVADGLWLDRRARLPLPHQPRRRRECVGELVQIDGSEHAWFEGRGPGCTLLAFVDDATSRLMLLRFVASESAFSYFGAVRAYLEAHGKPVALYSDKHGGYRQLVGLRSRWRAIRTSWSWLRYSGDAGDLGPNLKGLGPGGSILGGRHLMAAEVEQVVDTIVGGEEALCLTS